MRRRSLQGLILRSPELALQQMCEAVYTNSTVDEIADSAHLAVLYAAELARVDPAKAAGMDALAASLAYRQITSGTALPSTDPWNSRIVQTYNEAVAGVVSLLQSRVGALHADHDLSACSYSFRVKVQQGDAESCPPCYDEWLPADRWEQRGLWNRYRGEGLGARLIAVRTNRLVSVLERHLPDEGIFRPGTAILRFEALDSDSSGRQHTAHLLLFNPKITPEVTIGGRAWPLAADYTLPGAMLLARTRPLFKTRWPALTRPGESSRPRRLYLFEPYSPDRIPIIMVHGLRSTPLAWQQLTNELMGDPDIRRRYQIWHYLYPTGLPYLTSAADFRDEIETVRQLLDPASRDFATRHMIVIGHSMGGLLARTLITDSGDAVWDSTFAIPVSRLDAGPEQIAQLNRIFYFEPKAYIKRVIFIAVPHRGSKWADGLLGRLVSARVGLPDALNQFIARLKKSNPALLQPEAAPLFARGYPSSIRALSPRTPGLVALAKLPASSGIPFHSIIGDRGLGGGENSSDGVVPYSSSHLVGAESERIVPSNHRSYENLEAILEVKRILRLHAAGFAPADPGAPADRRGESAAESSRGPGPMQPGMSSGH